MFIYSAINFETLGLNEKGEPLMYYITIDGHRITEKAVTLKEILQRFCHTTGRVEDIEKHGYRLEKV